MATITLELRDAFIISKALVIAAEQLDAETDIRWREDSDLADMRYWLEQVPFAQWAGVHTALNSNKAIRKDSVI